MQRYFTDQPIQLQEVFSVTGDTFHHLVRVMRAKENEQAEFVAANHQVFLGKIKSIDEKSAEILPVKQLEHAVEMPIEVTIACGLSKGEKSEKIVQKGTEMGARHFIFLPTEFSVVKWPAAKIARKIDRLQKIAVGAAEQSHRAYIPTISYCGSLRELMQWPGKFKIVAYEESAKQGEHTQLHHQIAQMQANDEVLALFGPEGGLSTKEIKKLTDADFISVGLGPRILRAETAPLYFLTAISVFTEMR